MNLKLLYKIESQRGIDSEGNISEISEDVEVGGELVRVVKRLAISYKRLSIISNRLIFGLIFSAFFNFCLLSLLIYNATGKFL